jgi:hypothetical protein
VEKIDEKYVQLQVKVGAEIQQLKK